MENSYEMMLLNRSGLSEAEEKKIFSGIEAVIGKNGKITSTVNIGKRNLAYSIKKQSEGNYWTVRLSLESQAVSELNRKLAMEENVLRFLFLRREPEKNVKKSVRKSINKSDTKRGKK